MTQTVSRLWPGVGTQAFQLPVPFSLLYHIRGAESTRKSPPSPHPTFPHPAPHLLHPVKFASSARAVLTKWWEQMLLGEKMLRGPGQEINTWGETDQTCVYTAAAMLRTLIITNRHNETLVRTATSSGSPEALLGTGKDLLNISFSLGYVIREFLETFCVLCFKK